VCGWRRLAARVTTGNHFDICTEADHRHLPCVWIKLVRMAALVDPSNDAEKGDLHPEIAKSRADKQIIRMMAQPKDSLRGLRTVMGPMGTHLGNLSGGAVGSEAEVERHVEE
jgi:hypothetical protein